MKKFINLLCILIFNSCVSLSQSYDDVYFLSDVDTFNQNNNTYITNNYYDFDDYTYAARIRRFHSFNYYYSYYSPFYTNIYYYNPQYWGNNIYYNYNWWSPINTNIVWNYGWNSWYTPYWYQNNWYYTPNNNNYYVWGYYYPNNYWINHYHHNHIHHNHYYNSNNNNNHHHNHYFNKPVKSSNIYNQNRIIESKPYIRPNSFNTKPHKPFQESKPRQNFHKPNVSPKSPQNSGYQRKQR